ncbi:hypothetical protein D030_0649B, partial [Vibrio parahaemolyticus AQ3810]
INYFAT